MEGKQGVLWYFLGKKGELHRNEKLEPLLRSTGKPYSQWMRIMIKAQYSNSNGSTLNQ